MPNTLRDELRQAKPFQSQCQEALLNVARTASVLTDGLDAVLKPHGLGLTQYNVLRILRGAGDTGLCRNEIRDRLISRMPDVTRLLDRMEEAGLVSRTRSTDDRRLVATHLTYAGIALLNRLDDLIAAEHGRQLGHMTPEQLTQLIDLLRIARQRT
jgi:DNA-binding MarR family transcriptional regulator